ncbi:DUF5068 domain-containing protein [Macrococcus sp. DPC7161]|uniref:DUF5068 domain-containing protein n=1 Tax=Macrococcus sp. DPC7161 TaxID=2507060 RepID=UPI00100A8CC2|nr:DUF5068 domain-containing protein [Macrococcus sp. DPC7161]RXK17970.1 DUF5068 domain-containing protein [Macrococcus sp. DPC7161]
MKKVFISMATASLLLTACGSDEQDAKLTKEIDALKKEKAQLDKDYDALKKENKKIKEDLDKKKSDLDDENKKRQKALEKEVEKEQKEKLEKEKALKKQKEDEEKERLKDKKAKEKDILEATKQKEMPNTIASSTNGETSLVYTKNDVPISLNDAGMKVEIDKLQIFKVTKMPKGQVLLFDGATTGYVVLYQVRTENTTNETLYYNNNTKFTAGNHSVFSDFASFIKPEMHESEMKTTKNNYNAYAPKESTISYKSIAISEADYKLLKNKKASLVIQGGISKSKTFDNQSQTTSKPFTFD